MKNPKEEKTFLGAPMRWDVKNMFKPNWDKTGSRVIVPKTFGIGWTVNFHELLKRLTSLKK